MRKAKLGVALLLLAMLASCASVSDYGIREAEMSGHMRKGMFYFQAGVHNQAFRSFDRALRHTVYNVNIYYHLGETCRQLGKTELARYYLRYSLKYYPEDHRGYLLLGQLWALARPRYAERLLRAALRHAPAEKQEDMARQVADIRSPARALFNAQDIDASAREIVTAINAGQMQAVLAQSRTINLPARCAALARAGMRLKKQGRAKEAILLWEHVWVLNQDPELLVGIGNLYFSGADYTKACASYLRYTRVRSEDGKGYFNLGIVYLAHGLGERADVMFAKAGPVYGARALAAKAAHARGEAIQPLN